MRGLKSIDIYGQHLSLTYRGDPQFKTTPGALVSLAIFAILMAYAGFKTYVLFNRVNPNISKAGFVRDLDKDIKALRP